MYGVTRRAILKAGEKVKFEIDSVLALQYD